MMHYAQVVLQVEKLGCDRESASALARKVITAAALLAMMPEDVLDAWCESSSDNSSSDDYSISEPLTDSEPVFYTRYQSQRSAEVVQTMEKLGASKIMFNDGLSVVNRVSETRTRFIK